LRDKKRNEWAETAKQAKEAVKMALEAKEKMALEA
jgi:hypothetical protein